MNTSFLDKSKVKFLQIKQGTIRQKCCQNMKRDIVSVYLHISRDTPFTRMLSLRKNKW